MTATSTVVFLLLLFKEGEATSCTGENQSHNYLQRPAILSKLKIGQRGPSAARPAEVEPRREEGELFKRQRTEELSVRLWRKKSFATLTNVKGQSTAKLKIGHRGASAE